MVIIHTNMGYSECFLLLKFSEILCSNWVALLYIPNTLRIALWVSHEYT